ncbi:MAG: tRNA (adenosine(37)-N6)-threonylcarbamoyltransferase complex transferase subunit TsaD, partial [Candidatus Neomarinimicrobiota bacterium]
MEKDTIAVERKNLAAAYQQAIVDSIMDRLQQAVKITGLTRVCVAGGVAANSLFRRHLEAWSDTGPEVSFPPLEYCTDNAAMIAMAGYQRLQRGERSPLTLEIKPNLSLDQHAAD